MDQKKAVAFLLVLAVLAGGGCKGKGNLLVKVGSRSITEKDLDLLVRVNPRLKMRLATPDGKQKILENYVEQELLYQESRKRGLQRTSSAKDKLNLYEKIIVAQALLDDELDRKAKEYFENHRDEFERLKVSHILIRTQPPEDQTESGPAKDKKKLKAGLKRSDEEALNRIEEVKARLAKGEGFGEVAKSSSEDDRTKGSLGDLGLVTIKDKRLERWGWLPIAEKAFAMKLSEVSEPIKTKDGFHLIQVTEEKKLQPYDEAEMGIKFRIQADIRTALLDDLKKKNHVTWAKTEASGPPAAAEVPPATQPAEGQPKGK